MSVLHDVPDLNCRRKTWNPSAFRSGPTSLKPRRCFFFFFLRGGGSQVTSALTHEPGRVGVVRPHFAVHLDEALVQDLLAFVVGQRVLESVAQEHHQRKALAQLVWPCAGSGGLKKE